MVQSQPERSTNEQHPPVTSQLYAAVSDIDICCKRTGSGRIPIAVQKTVCLFAFTPVHVWGASFYWVTRRVNHSLCNCRPNYGAYPKITPAYVFFYIFRVERKIYSKCRRGIVDSAKKPSCRWDSRPYCLTADC